MGWKKGIWEEKGGFKPSLEGGKLIHFKKHKFLLFKPPIVLYFVMAGVAKEYIG